MAKIPCCDDSDVLKEVLKEVRKGPMIEAKEPKRPRELDTTKPWLPQGWEPPIEQVEPEPIPTKEDKHRQFDFVVKHRIEKITSILASKASEYADTADRYHNFNVAARMDDGETPEQALKGMWKKHLVSVFDLIAWTKDCPERITEALIDEKIGDAINYLILLEGMLRLRV